MLSTAALHPGPPNGDLNRVFRALADNTRRSILGRLAAGPARISELAKPFDMSLPAVSKHLRVLERAGLVKREIRGRDHFCSLCALPLRDAEAWIAHYRQFWEGTLQSLSEHLQEQDDKR